jgi:hypothetical protein
MPDMVRMITMLNAKQKNHWGIALSLEKDKRWKTLGKKMEGSQKTRKT